LRSTRPRGPYFVLKGDTKSATAYVGDDDHPGGMAYAIPRQGEVLVGGSAKAGREDLELTLDWEDTIRRAGLCIPWLRERVPADQSRAPVVGIRPCCPKGVRVEVDHDSARAPVVHNYGHGGSGFSLSWGCAETVQRILASL
jgi:D-amino-acid oxidase